MTNFKEKYTELCKQFITEFFEEHVPAGAGVYTECFWEVAEKSGLWVRGTYGSPMSKALLELTTVETVSNDDGDYMYSIFKLK